jgi:glycosyltransferase involved in cell wall biosynthesis
MPSRNEAQGGGLSGAPSPAVPPRRVLMVAYHFPPLAGSSGVQRTLRFVQHLPQQGWQPLVLSASERAYESVSADLMADVPAGCTVRRAFALDTARHLSIAGRYLHAMARPDRWVSWRFAGVREGLRMIREFSPDAIWSTYPIATAHLIGAELHRRTGLPWIADFRDPMAQTNYPPDPQTRQSFRDIEQLAMRHAAVNLFTTPGAVRMYRERYPYAAERIRMLENGYDESSFAAVADTPRERLHEGAVTLLHSGIVYPSERNPTQLFAALGRLAREGALPPSGFRLRFRASVHDVMLERLAAEHGVADRVEVLPPIAYRAALQEMMRADALLVMQGAGCNEQVPAKVYEYLRARRPVLCLADPAGDTQAVLQAAGVRSFARLASADEIAGVLPAFVQAVREGIEPLPDAQHVASASREMRTRALADHLLQAVRA